MSNTFTGGVFPDYSELKRKTPVTPADPESVTLRIPDGYSTRVRGGETVFIGTVLADGDGAALLSGISGTVSLFGGFVTVKNDYLGRLSPALHPAEKRISEMSGDELRDALHVMGVPTPSVPSKKPAECIIADCCEPDTGTVSAAATVFDRAEAVAGGLRIFMKLTGTAKGYLAVPRHMHACADELSGHADGRLVKIKTVSDKYPQHEPHMLVSALFNLEINPLTDTGKAGYPVIPAEVCAAAFDALAKGIPYTSSYITVSGIGRTAGVYSVPFGTEIKSLPALCGSADGGIVFTGGEMTAKEVSDGEYTSPGVFAVSVAAEKAPEKPEAHECTDCGRCAAVCPVRLLPSLIYGCRDTGKASKAGAEYCISCGCCDRVCPAGIELRATISEMKKEMNKEVTA